MAVPLEEFVQQLEDSGILAGDTIKDFIPPKGSSKDADELVRELVRQKKLTTFQAEEVAKGNGKSLVLGNYVLLEKIGAGGMGEVYKAEHRRMDRIVAVKVLPASTMKDPATIARFEREVKAAAKINHPNIVAAHDADCANGVHFLVMELIEGSDLSALVKKNGPFTVEKAVNYCIQAAKGLEAAHKKGIVHRDIKPANLLLDHEGVVKILDMGLARIDTAGVDVATQAELTGSGAVMGTVDYMSPEQAFNTKHADARADIYSLGCTLYYLLAGKATYSGETVIEKILAHREKPIPSLKDVQAGIPPQLETVFQKMVAKKAEDRYPNMTQLLVDLEKCCRGNETTLVFPERVAPASDFGQTNLLDSGSIRDAQPAVRTKPAPGKSGKKPYLLIGTVILGVLILLAGLVVKVKTKDGTLVVTVNEPDAQVEVLNEEGKVEISQKGGKGTISISVDPGKHRLKVTKDGFTVFGQDFEIESGGKQPIMAKLVPLDEKPVVGTKPVAVVPVSPPAVAGPKKPLFFQTPEFEPWAKQVAAMPAEKQVEAVSKKLVELNSGFDGKVTGDNGIGTPWIANGVVFMIGIVTDNVTDISPLRALVGLTGLDIRHGNGTNTGGLMDLLPLQGIPIVSLEATSPRISDLSSLKGMPLDYLVCAGTRVSDLSPLKGMPLTHLIIEGTQVSDLSPLQGMPLKVLSIYGTHINDLSPLKGMSLKELRMDNTLVSDLLPLKDLPIQNLYLDFAPNLDTSLLRSIKTLTSINGKPVAEFCEKVEAYKAEAKRSLAFEAPGFDQWIKHAAALPAEEQVQAVAKKLQELNPGFDGKVMGWGQATPFIENGVVVSLGFFTDEVTDISPVRALVGLSQLDIHGSSSGKGKLLNLSPLKSLPLKHLGIYCTQVSDLSPLQGMKITILNCGTTLVADLSPLKGMKLEYLDCYQTKVSDLSPLSGMPLRSLKIAVTFVSDLSPLQGTQLIEFFCHQTKVSDFSLLKDMPLTHLLLDFHPDRDTEIVRSIKTLEMINEKPAAEFWKEVEGTAGPKKPLFFQTPGYEPWAKEVAAMPAEQQVEAVSKKLVELNPGFDGKVMGPQTQAAPTINGGILTGIGFHTDNVTDISPVRALAGLKVLFCTGSLLGKGNLEDLSPLKGMPLQTLSMAYNPRISTISPLQGMKLGVLDCAETNVSDLTPLKGMPLTDLLASQIPLTDLSPLMEMPLLKMLNIDYAPVTDLSPLTGMSLKYLYLNSVQFTDLSPLNGMPLEIIDIRRTHASTLSTLTKMPLKALLLDFKPFRDTDLLRSIKTLEAINFKPIADFWKEVEEKKAAFDQWVKDVAAMSAEKQVEAVSKKLMELNPGFDGKVEPGIEAGVVTGLTFFTDNVTDISPVRALARLSFLKISTGSGKKTNFADISPLKGLPLTLLNIQATQVADLSPLQGMKLLSLACSTSNVSDLSPLKGMPLIDLLLEQTQVSNLSPLNGMPLTRLKFGFTQVNDISPLKGMSLANLDISGLNISDLSPYKDFSLKQLHLGGNPVADLSPLKDMPLEDLNIDGTLVTDLSPIKKLPLKTLIVGLFHKSLITDLSPLKEMSVQHLYLDFKPFRDTELLRSIKTLETINGKPTAEFWKEADAKQAAFDQWAKDVQAMSAEKQVEAVSKKLVELNPGFDGKVTPVIQEGVVATLVFWADNVTDISPVRALAQLKHLNCPGSTQNKAKLADLSPLKGMKLVSVGFGNTQVSDLTPLEGMKLADLGCQNTHVFDLTPLEGMKLTNLSCEYTHVFDLSPLRGMELLTLMCESTKVADLSPLKDMKLTFLDCDHTQVSNLSPLTSMKLTYMSCAGTKVSDLSPLKDMPLTVLYCDGTQVSDLSPLKGMPLETIGCNHCPVTDLMPLNGMPLALLHISWTKVSDLSPLKGMQLTLLTLNELSVSDLSALKGMRLELFDCQGAKVTDLSILRDMPLKTLTLDFKPFRDTELLRSIKTLEMINGKPAAEFWKEVEEQQKEKKQ